MNVHNNLILVKGVDKTQEIESCKYDTNQHKYLIKFNTSPQEYPYGSSNVTWLKNPKIIKSDSVRISHNGAVFFDIQEIFDFNEYYQIIFGNGKTSIYLKSDLKGYNLDFEGYHRETGCIDFQRKSGKAFVNIG